MSIAFAALGGGDVGAGGVATSKVPVVGRVAAPSSAAMAKAIAAPTQDVPLPTTPGRAGVDDQAELITTLAKSLNVSEDEAKERFAFDSAASQTVADARATLGDSFSAAVIDFDTRTVHIALVGEAARAQGLRRDGVNVVGHSVTRNADQLKADQWDFNQEQAENGSRVRARLDELNGTLVFQVPDTGYSKQEQAAAEAGAAARGYAWASEALAVVDKPNYAACTKTNCDVSGSGVENTYRDYYGHIKGCTSGVLGYKASEAAWHVLGAGHCADPAYSGLTGAEYMKQGATTIGPVTGYYVSPTVPLDMAATKVTASVALSLTAHVTDTTAYAPIGALQSAPVSGELLCASGSQRYLAYGTYMCGYVVPGGAQLISSGGTVAYVINEVSCLGDSGALVFKPMTVGGVYHRYASSILSTVSSTSVGGGCYDKTGVVSIADNVAVWNSWGWGLVYYAHPAG